MKRFLIALYFLASLSASSVFGADPRYTLTEYSMNGCGACVEAEKDVAEIVEAGIAVRCVNTSVDPIGDAEARRLNLHLRPAWRLANARGVEIGRWYGARKAGLIVATIRAKFPTPDAEEPVAAPIDAREEEISDADVIQEQEQTVAPDLAPSALAELDSLKSDDEKSDDFRDRKPVSEPFLDSSFLDRSLDEWENRDEEEEEEPRRFSEPGESDARLGNRIAEKAAAAILDGLDPKINAIKREALAKFESIGEKATRRLEDRVGQEFQAAKTGLSARFAEAIGDVRSDVLKELSTQINAAIKSLALKILFFAGVCFVAWILWRHIKKGYANQ